MSSIWIRMNLGPRSGRLGDWPEQVAGIVDLGTWGRRGWGQSDVITYTCKIQEDGRTSKVVVRRV